MKKEEWKNKQNIYPEVTFKNSQVSLISCIRNTLGIFRNGFGIRLNANGPASGGFVFFLNICGGPTSVFNVVYFDPSIGSVL